METTKLEFSELDKLESQTLFDVTESADILQSHLIDEETSIFDFEDNPTEKPKKETRGRKPKTAPSNLIDVDDSTFVHENSNLQDPTKPEKYKLNVGDVIPSDTVLLAFESGMKIILPFALKALAKSQINPKDLSLTASEKVPLKSSLTDAMKTLNIDLSNPWAVLGLTVLSIYGAKVTDIISNGGTAVKTERRGRPKGSTNKTL